MLNRFAMLVVAAGTMLAVACGQSDPGITTAVKSKLAVDDTVKAYELDVDTSDRVVTLSGVVETQAAKDQAVMLARQTDGVRDVIDQITVGGEAATTGEFGDDIREEAREGADAVGDTIDRSQGAVTDAAITTAVKGKFLGDTDVSGLKIDVDTSGGVVTLTGTAATRAEADRAASLARETNGVRQVVNNIRVSG